MQTRFLWAWTKSNTVYLESVDSPAEDEGRPRELLQRLAGVAHQLVTEENVKS